MPRVSFPEKTTENTRRFRESGLSERDERTISNVKHSVAKLFRQKRNSAGPGWSYTLGVHDTCGQPEVITVGLREETAHFLLNEKLESGLMGAPSATSQPETILRVEPGKAN
jgi:hypothetical protein